MYAASRVYVASRVCAASRECVASRVYAASRVYVASRVYAASRVYVASRVCAASRVYVASRVHAACRVCAASRVYAARQISQSLFRMALPCRLGNPIKTVTLLPSSPYGLAHPCRPHHMDWPTLAVLTIWIGPPFAALGPPNLSTFPTYSNLPLCLLAQLAAWPCQSPPLMSRVGGITTATHTSRPTAHPAPCVCVCVCV